MDGKENVTTPFTHITNHSFLYGDIPYEVEQAKVKYVDHN